MQKEYVLTQRKVPTAMFFSDFDKIEALMSDNAAGD